MLLCSESFCLLYTSPPPPEPIGEDCPLCGSPLVIKSGRFGDFIGCSGFSDPEKKCRYTRPILKTTGVTCPKCSEGEVVRRKGKKGKPFYGCSRYPECDYVSFTPVSYTHLIADLAGDEGLTTAHLAEALAFREGGDLPWNR